MKRKESQMSMRPKSKFLSLFVVTITLILLAREALPAEKVLNNFVTELLKVKVLASQPYKEYRFSNPREGWVFISSTADIKGSDKISITIDSLPRKKALIIHKRGKERTLEAMRFLSSGRHKISVWSGGKSTLQLLEVRSIPEILYCEFGYDSHVTEYGPYDWKFLRKHVLNNVNVIVGSNYKKYGVRLRKWRKEGKKWINEPGIVDKKSGEEYYQHWASVGFENPLDGTLLDEFGSRPLKVPLWSEAVRKIYENKKFEGKTFYPYVYGNPKVLQPFIQTIIDCGYKFAWERYLKEQATEEKAREFIEEEIKKDLLGWQKVIPGSQKHMILCFGYLCAPPESLNTNPGADYKVFMDMQFHLAANDPAFSGLYGIMEYTSGYTDEEIVRWTGKLYRHYCVEGKRERLSKDPYALSHIENPDFAQGRKGWTLSRTEGENIEIKRMKGFGWLEGRYPRTEEGDSFLWMKRSAKKANVVSQKVKGLEPGRLYSLKMYSADYKDLIEGKSAKRKHGISIKLENVEPLFRKSFQHVFANCYSHHLGSFNREHKFWMNYHWKVFRAKAETARLVISDWRDNKPGGPIGQELIYNFVEVQPYLED